MLRHPYHRTKGDYILGRKLTCVIPVEEAEWLLNRTLGGKKGYQDAILSHFLKKLITELRPLVDPYLTIENELRISQLIEQLNFRPPTTHLESFRSPLSELGELAASSTGSDSRCPIPSLNGGQQDPSNPKIERVKALRTDLKKRDRKKRTDGKTKGVPEIHHTQET